MNQVKQLLARSQHGFTMVELLIVIAIIGILAAIVIAALDPGEQIRRANDAKAKDKVSTVGNAAQAYYTASGASGQPTYPIDQNAMSSSGGSGDLKQPVLTDPGQGYCGGTAAGCAAFGSCTSASSCPNMVAYAPLTSKQSQNIATNLGASGCTISNTYYVYIANNTDTRAGFYCGGAPTAGTAPALVFKP